MLEVSCIYETLGYPKVIEASLVRKNCVHVCLLPGRSSSLHLQVMKAISKFVFHYFMLFNDELFFKLMLTGK